MASATADIDLPDDAPAPPVQPSTPATQPGRSVAKVVDNSGSMDLESPDFQRNAIAFYKARKNQRDRIALLAPKQMVWARRHYHQGEEGLKYFICLSEFTRAGKQDVLSKQAICCEKLGEPKRNWAAPIMVYTTDQKGVPIKPLTFDLKVWVFSDTMLETLRTISEETSLALQDLLVTCDEEQYQKLTLVPTAKGGIFASDAFQKSALAPEVHDWIKAILPKLRSTLGRTVAQSEAIKALGGAVSVGAAVDVDPVGDLSDLINS